MARLKRLGPTEEEHICSSAPSLTAQAAIRLAASTKRARHVADAHKCLTHTSSSIAVIQGPGVTAEVPGAAAGLCRQDSPVGQQTPQQSGCQPGCVERNQKQRSGAPSPTRSSADADSNAASSSSKSSTECSSRSGSGEECSSGDVGGCDEQQLCSSCSHGGQNGGSNHRSTAAAPATPGDVRQWLPRAGSSSTAATSSSHNSSRNTSSDDTSSGDTSSDSCSRSSDGTSSDGSSGTSSASSSSDDTSSDKSSSDHTSSNGTGSDNPSRDGPSSDGTSSGTDTSRATSSEPSSSSSRGNTTSCPGNSVGGSNGQKHSGPSSSDNTSSPSGTSGSGSDPASDRSSSSDDTSSTSGSSDSSSGEATSSSADCASSGSSSSGSAGSSANDDGLAAQPSAAVDPDWAVSGCSEGGTDDSGFAQCSSTLGDELEHLQGPRRPGAATAAESDAQGPEGAPLQAGAAVRQPPAAALAVAPPDGCVRLLVLELCAGTCPVAEQVRLSRLIPAGGPTYEVVAYAAVEREPALAAAAPTAQSLGIKDKQHLVTCGDVTDEQVQQRVLRFVRKALKRQIRAGQPIQAILVAAGPPCQPYSNAVAPPSPNAPGEQRKAFRQKRRLMRVQGDKVVQAVLGVWDGIRGLVASTAAAQHNHNSTQAPLPDAAVAGAAAGPSIVRTSAACSTLSKLPCYLVLESVASTASLALRNRPCMKQRLAGHQLLRSRHHWCTYGSAHHAKKPSDVFTNMKGMPTIVPCTHGHKRHLVTVRGTLGQVSRAIWPGEFASRCLLLAAEEARQQGAA